LRAPSVVAVVSASWLFLEVARACWRLAIGNRHELLEILPPDANPAAARADHLLRFHCKKRLGLPVGDSLSSAAAGID
jgi:hypothetical protein